jgi:putative monooxygenase
MSIEIISIKSLDDMPKDTRRGGAVQVLLSPKTIGSTTGFMGMATLQPGERISEHYHPYSEEFIYVMRGRIIAQCDGTRHEIGSQQGMVVPIGVKHRLLNEGSEEAQLVFHLCPLAPRPDMGHVDTE